MLTLNPRLSLEESATRGHMVQRPGWDRLCCEFPKERCTRHRLPASAALTVFPQRITLRPSCEVAGKVLWAAGGGEWEASGEGQWVVRGCCSPESIQRNFWIDIELGKHILQCSDESIFLPTSKAESVVVLLSSFVFISMLCILMTHAVRICGGWCCQMIFR